jgi:folylpolyglutamate synthase/dihydrofolate synthase
MPPRLARMSIDLSLNRIRALAARLPSYTRPTIHIAGTNGKGSAAAIVSSILRESGLRVGRFNSPHFVHVWDCIDLCGHALSPEQYERVRKEVEDANEGIDASSFEVLTSTALKLFEDEKVDVVVLEVGMGGRLDATNVIPDDAVAVSVITSIGLDHMQWLGDTIEAIAKEKAGIMRKAGTVILGPQSHPNVKSIVSGIAGELGSTVVDASSSVHLTELPCSDPKALLPPSREVVYRGRHFRDDIPLYFPLHGAHQLENLATSLTTVECLVESGGSRWKSITPTTIANGVQKVRWPGRLSWHDYGGLRLLADGAHNEASATALRQYLDSLPTLANSPRTFVVSLSHSPPKTARSVLEPLLQPGDSVALTGFSPVVGMPWVRPVSVEELLSISQEMVGVDGTVASFCGTEESPLEYLHQALEWASNRSDLAIVSGSLYLVADLYRVLGKASGDL